MSVNPDVKTDTPPKNDGVPENKNTTDIKPAENPKTEIPAPAEKPNTDLYTAVKEQKEREEKAKSDAEKAKQIEEIKFNSERKQKKAEKQKQWVVVGVILATLIAVSILVIKIRKALADNQAHESPLEVVEGGGDIEDLPSGDVESVPNGAPIEE